MGLIADIITAGLGPGSTAELLNKVLVAAQRLGDDSMRDFSRSELNGYQGSELPEHRQIRGQLAAQGSWREWVPVQVSPKLAFMEIAKFPHGVAHLEQLVAGAADGSVQITFSASQQEMLRRVFEVERDFVFHLLVPNASVVQCLQQVRTKVIDWAATMEREGVVGEGLSFTTAEKRVATAISHVVNNYGVISGSPILQGANGRQEVQLGPDLSSLAELMEIVIRHADQLGASAGEAAGDANTVLAQLSSGRPKEGIVRASLESLRSILENAAGSWLADQVLPKLVVYLPALATLLVGLGT